MTFVEDQTGRCPAYHKDCPRVGRPLAYDGSREAFAGDPPADGMLRRAYRRPYVVPEDV